MQTRKLTYIIRWTLPRENALGDTEYTNAVTILPELNAWLANTVCRYVNAADEGIYELHLSGYNSERLLW